MKFVVPKNPYLQAKDDFTLKGTRQVWLRGFENLPHKQEARFKALRESGTKEAQAWKVNELLRSLWKCQDEEDATAHLKGPCHDAMSIRLEPVKNVFRMLKPHCSNVVTYFRNHLCNAAPKEPHPASHPDVLPLPQPGTFHA